MQEDFPVLESRINKRASVIGKVLIIFLALLIFSTLIVPISEFIKYGFIEYFLYRTQIFFALLFMIVLVLGSCSYLIMLLVDSKKTDKVKIVINKEGAFFYDENGKAVRKYLYSELCKSSTQFSDIQLKTYSRTFRTDLIINVKGESGKVREDIMSVHYGIQTLANSYELYQHFLKGVQLFRPDIAINLMVLNTYRINPDPIKTKLTKSDILFNIFIGICALGIFYILFLLIKAVIGLF